MNRRHLGWVLGGLAALGLLGGGHYAYWRGSAAQVVRGYALWRAQAERDGWTVETGVAEPGGYPLAARLRLPGVRLSRADQGIAWQADDVVLRVMLHAPLELVIDADGGQRLHLADGTELPFHAGQWRLTLPLEPGLPSWSRFEAASVRLDAPGAEGALAHLHARVEQRPAASAGQVAVTISAEADALTIPPRLTAALGPGLGPEISHITLRATLTGPLPRTASPARIARDWRDGNGSVDIAALDLRWGKLVLTAQANLSLDERLQPAGTAILHLRGHEQALDALVASGALPPATAQLARMMIGLFAGAPTGGGAPEEAEIPLSLNQRRLFARQLPLGRLPALRWAP